MLTLSTDVVPESRRFDYWRKLVSNNLISVSIDREARGPFFGSFLAQQIGSSWLWSVNSTSQYISRTGHRITEDRKNLILLNYLVEGQGSLTQQGNRHDIAGGDFFVHDSGSVGDLHLSGDFKILTLSLSRVLADRYFARAQYLCAAPLSIRLSPAAQVAADMLQSVARNCIQMEDDSAETVIESLVRIVALAYGLPSMKDCGVSTGQSALLVRVRNYILAHLEDEELAPGRIAAKHGISERYLSKLFASEATTVSKWIWIQRLESARRALLLPQLAHRKLNEIAYACGFNDMSHFSFSFKRRFGCTPREFRARKFPS